MDPLAQVLVGGLLLDCDPNQPPSGANCTSSKFLEGILNNNGAASFDGVSYHAYDYYGGVPGTYANTNWHTTWEAGGPSLINKGNYLLSLLKKFNAEGKYLLNTENALLCDSCMDDIEFENTKAYYLAEAYAGAIAQNLKANIWFSVIGEWGRNNGLLDKTTAGLPPLPAYYAYKFAAQELDGVSYVGKVTSFPGVKGYEFSKADRHVWLLWSPDGSDITVDLLVVPMNVFDVDGDPVPFTDERIIIQREPYYVELPASLPRLNLPAISLRLFPLINGDFEASLEGWTAANHGLPISVVSSSPMEPATGTINSSIPSGSRSALLGNINYPCTAVPFGDAEISQTFTVPNLPNTQVLLEFDYIIYTQDASTGIEYDRFEVYIQDAGTPVLRYWDGNMS